MARSGGPLTRWPELVLGPAGERRNRAGSRQAREEETMTDPLEDVTCPHCGSEVYKVIRFEREQCHCLDCDLPHHTTTNSMTFKRKTLRDAAPALLADRDRLREDLGAIADLDDNPGQEWERATLQTAVYLARQALAASRKDETA